MPVVYDHEADAFQRWMILFVQAFPGYPVDKIAVHPGRPGGCEACRRRLAALVSGGYVRVAPADSLFGPVDGYFLTTSGQRFAAELRRRPMTDSEIAEALR